MILAEKDGEIPRPAFLEYNEKAFAFKVLDESNAPVYRPRDHLVADPETPALSGDDCVFTDGMDAKEGSAALVGNLIRWTATNWIIVHYGRRGEVEASKADYPHAWPIVARYMRK